MTNVDFRQTLPLSYNVSAETISRWLRHVPPVARISVNVSKGDRNESDSYSLTAAWNGPVDD